MPYISLIPTPQHPHEFAFNEAVKSDIANQPYEVVHYLMLANALGSFKANQLLTQQGEETLRVNAHEHVKSTPHAASIQSDEDINDYLHACCVIFSIGYVENQAVARELVYTLAEKDHTPSLYLAGFISEIDGNQNEAAHYYERAVAAGHVLARVHLGQLYLQRGERERTRALYEEAAATSDNYHLHYQLAVLYSEDDPETHPESLDKAKQIFLKYAEQGDVRAAQQLTNLYSSIASDPGSLWIQRQELHWLKQTAILFDQTGCSSDSVDYVESIGSKRALAEVMQATPMFNTCNYELAYLALYHAQKKGQDNYIDRLAVFMEWADSVPDSFELDIAAIQSLDAPFAHIMCDILHRTRKEHASNEVRPIEVGMIEWFCTYLPLLEQKSSEQVLASIDAQVLQDFTGLFNEELIFQRLMTKEPSILLRCIDSLAHILLSQANAGAGFIAPLFCLFQKLLLAVGINACKESSPLLTAVLVKLASFGEYELSITPQASSVPETDISILIDFAERAVKLVMQFEAPCLREPSGATYARSRVHNQVDAAAASPMVEMTEARARHLAAVSATLNSIIPGARPITADNALISVVSYKRR